MQTGKESSFSEKKVTEYFVPKRTIKIGGSFEGVVSTGPYQNARPGFYVEEIIEGSQLTDDEIFKRQNDLYLKSYANFVEAENKAIIERINRERQDFHWYKLPTGMYVPSVTSIINFDSDFWVSPEMLRQYAAQGSLTHIQVSKYFETKKWLDPQDIPEAWVDYVILKKGSLGLSWEGIKFEDFLTKHPFNVRGWDVSVLNSKDQYGGKLDFWGEDPVDGLVTICDVKRTVDKFKNFMQISAYAKAAEESLGVKIQKMRIVPLQPGKTEQGFSKPVDSLEIDKHFALFMEKREQFKKRYGV